MSQSTFAVIPICILKDDRLNRSHLRILIALLSLNTEEVINPPRHTISELTGYSLNAVSRYTGELVKLGYLNKTGNGGRGISSGYELVYPESMESEG